MYARRGEEPLVPFPSCLQLRARAESFIRQFIWHRVIVQHLRQVIRRNGPLNPSSARRTVASATSNRSTSP